jgi:hypothetical protein
LTKRTRTAAHPRNKVHLDTLAGVRSEIINERIKSAESARLVYILREVRSCIEVEALAAQAAAVEATPVTTINVTSIPTTFCVDEKDPNRIRPQFYIDHLPAETIEQIDDRPEPTDTRDSIESEIDTIDPEPELESGIIVIDARRRRKASREIIE